MWNQEIRQALASCLSFAESKFIVLRELVEEFITAYCFYIIVGLLILIILVIVDQLMKWQEKKEKKKIEAEIEKQIEEE
jgi:hypothetical protein